MDQASHVAVQALTIIDTTLAVTRFSHLDLASHVAVQRLTTTDTTLAVTGFLHLDLVSHVAVQRHITTGSTTVAMVGCAEFKVKNTVNHRKIKCHCNKITSRFSCSTQLGIFQSS